MSNKVRNLIHILVQVLNQDVARNKLFFMWRFYEKFGKDSFSCFSVYFGDHERLLRDRTINRCA